MTISTGIITAKFASVEFVFAGFTVVSVGLVIFSINFVEEYCVAATDSLMIKDDKFLIISFNQFPLHSEQLSFFCNVCKKIIDNDCTDVPIV